MIEKVDTKYAKLWADELMIAQVKDWYRRENGLRWRGPTVLEWAKDDTKMRTEGALNR